MKKYQEPGTGGKHLKWLSSGFSLHTIIEFLRFFHSVILLALKVSFISLDILLFGTSEYISLMLFYPLLHQSAHLADVHQLAIFTRNSVYHAILSRWIGLTLSFRCTSFDLEVVSDFKTMKTPYCCGL